MSTGEKNMKWNREENTKEKSKENK